MSAEPKDDINSLYSLWGRGENDIGFMVGKGSGDTEIWLTGSNANTYHYESRYTFTSIPWDAYHSMSLSAAGTDYTPDHTNFRHFKLMETTEKNKGFQYRSYFPFGSTSQSLNAPQDGFKDGIPIGTTAYFATGSDGKIYYPKNHVIYFNTTKDDCPNSIGYEGTQNINPGLWPVGFNREDMVDDLSEQAFYSVIVEETNKLQVFNP
jgi:hypothetical protein